MSRSPFKREVCMFQRLRDLCPYPCDSFLLSTILAYTWFIVSVVQFPRRIEIEWFGPACFLIFSTLLCWPRGWTVSDLLDAVLKLLVCFVVLVSLIVWHVVT